MQRTERPWGWFSTLDENSTSTYKVKTIYVKPNQKISLQFHNHRKEYWIVVEGDGILTLDDSQIELNVGSSVTINEKQLHRVEAGNFGIKIIETQYGSLCEETDIVRIQDDYGRV